MDDAEETNGATTFTPFSKLPTELYVISILCEIRGLKLTCGSRRIKIWKYAVHVKNPLNVKVTIGNSATNPIRCRSPAPGIFHTCRESRTEALKAKLYKNCLQDKIHDDAKKAIYLNPKTDTLFLHVSAKPRISWWTWCFLTSPDFNIVGSPQGFGKDCQWKSGEVMVRHIFIETVYSHDRLIVIRRCEEIEKDVDDIRFLQRAGYVVGGKVDGRTIKNIAVHDKSWYPLCRWNSSYISHIACVQDEEETAEHRSRNI